VSSGHSRVPVYHGTLDNIVGILYSKDLLKHLPSGGADFRLGPALRQPIYTPETRPIAELLREFQRERRHIAIVLDEYGGTAGLVTLEDILEELVGEIEDEYDRPEGDVTRLNGGRLFLAHARVNLEELQDRTGIAFPSGEEEYESLGGFLIARFGRVPRKGDTLDLDQARLTIEEATPRRILRVRIERRQLEPPAYAAQGD
jgi:CBS domain containing-hemolysin-like protein